MFGLFKRKPKPPVVIKTDQPPPLDKEGRALIAGVFDRAGITAPSEEDWQWGAGLWAQGARDPDELDRVLRVRLDFIEAQRAEAAS